jgi:hypothetical protein
MPAGPPAAFSAAGVWSNARSTTFVVAAVVAMSLLLPASFCSFVAGQWTRRSAPPRSRISAGVRIRLGHLGANPNG